MTVNAWKRRAAGRLGRALLLLAGLFFIARGVVELATVDPRRPETYRQDWGGPHYLGVLLVHAGPGLVALLLMVREYRRKMAGRQAT